MPAALAWPRKANRSAAIGLTLAVHLLLIFLWSLSRAPRPLAAESETTMSLQWLRPVPRAAAAPPAPAPARTRPAAAPNTPVAAPPFDAAMVAPSAAEPPLAAEPAPPPAPTADNTLQQARRQVGKIDHELRKESRQQFHAPVSTPQIRLVQGIEAATRLPSWFEAARIEDIPDQGGYGRRMYKVKTPMGIVCWTVESNHSADGQDVFRGNTTPKQTSCPRE